uniref:Origin recognition complex subunit 6 n=1 Tax=Tetraselmis sp. GSL018 TaxID=582737 RepID=A0A061SE02_9CHLO|eukprot:CAMPEP_0177585458 /NCGR_PEP_ID=MMETSP0419_2-20121207/4504_1 /TAXON_ID=582737 /ORGANISM="Tetraselmis sp., Strain GSL018" /LENGTH=290 /DNA_ID=CAMNT_0019075193 /DNA_START=332 /DNA_END=1207 /DNA_ORIENTATION=-
MSNSIIDVIAKRIFGSGDPNVRRICDKAKELDRRISVKISQGLGEGEVCRPVVCLELAAKTLNIFLKPEPCFSAASGAPEKLYRRTLLLVQKLLGIRQRVTARELVEQFQCVRLEAAVQRTVDAFKERYRKALGEGDRGAADFGRPVFVVAAFYLVAKKHKVPRVDRPDLLRLAVADEAEFSKTVNSIMDLCYDFVGVSRSKRAAEDVKQNRELLDRARFHGASCEAAQLDPTDPLQKNAENKAVRQWKEKIVQDISTRHSKGNEENRNPKKLRQGTLGFIQQPQKQLAR